MDTVTTMNTVITQVVDGSRLAEQAGEQMTALWRKSGLKGKFGGNQQVVLATQSPWERSQASFPSSHCLDQTRSPSVVITADAISPAHRVSDCYSVEGDQLPGANVSRDLLT